jgi:hypothetical protein
VAFRALIEPILGRGSPSPGESAPGIGRGDEPAGRSSVRQLAVPKVCV